MLIPKTRRGALWRFLAGSLVIVACAAGTTAVAALLQVKQIVTYISQTAPIKHADVTLPPSGAPQTLLLIGSDHRAGTSYTSANTDTMMLVRIDDSSSTINLLSIPRDLEVQLPTGGGATGGFKLNAAYSFGGPNLLINTLKTQVFPGLVVNHILDLNFGGFEKLIDAIGCVYGQVDHRYYNNTAQTDYSSIDVQPGYQRLCDTQALEFVRFRHTDSDIVRNARQQDFIRWAKQNYSVDQLLGNEDTLIKIFGASVQTDHDLHTTDGLINLFNLIVNADGLELKSIPFPAIFGACGGSAGTLGQTSAAAQTPCYVYSTPGQEAIAYHEFVTPTATRSASSSSASAGRSGKPKALAKAPTAGLAADPGDGRSQSAQLGPIAIPVYYPREIVAGSEYCFAITANCDTYPNPQSEYKGSYPRNYLIHAPGGGAYRSYVFTLAVNPILGEYYTVQGTTWMHPPILRDPTQTVNVGGRTLQEYFNGGGLSVVAWSTPQASYWVANTLTDSIPARQMVGMAASLALYKP